MESTRRSLSCRSFFFFFNDPATPEIYTLSLHDALPISRPAPRTRPTGTRHRGPCRDRKSTRLNSSHVKISYAVFCLKKKKTNDATHLPFKTNRALLKTESNIYKH